MPQDFLGGAKMDFGDAREFFFAVGLNELAGGGFDSGRSALGKRLAEFLFHGGEAADEFAPGEDGGGGHGEVGFGFVALDKLNFASKGHEGARDGGLFAGELVADGANRGRFHLVTLAHEVFDDTGVAPGEELVDAAHFGMKAVVGLVADADDGGDAARSFFDDIGQFADAAVARYVLGVADAASLPGFDDPLVDVNAGDAEGSEEVAFAAFIDAEAGEQKFGVEDGLVAEGDFLEDEGFEGELDKFTGALALDDEFAALIKDDADTGFGGGEEGVGNFPELKAFGIEPSTQGVGLCGDERAGIGGQGCHTN